MGSSETFERHSLDRSTTATVGLEGGMLKLYGVSLKIPPGALLEKKKITLKIIRNRHHQLTLDDQTALLSPIVSCEPPGLHFRKPVELVLPHCAQTKGVATIEEAWEFTVLKSETELHETEDWEETTSDDCSDRNITDKYVHVQIHHFSRWSITGIIRDVRDYLSSSKKIKLVAYSPTRDNTHIVFKIFVCCLDDYPENFRVSKLLLQHTANIISRLGLDCT